MPRTSTLLLLLWIGVTGATRCWAADRVVFLRSSPTEAALYIANADGTDERALTGSDSWNYNPAWSPKGDWIAFTEWRTADPLASLGRKGSLQGKGRLLNRGIFQARFGQV